MYDIAPTDPLIFQPEKQLWLRTLFLHATVVQKESVEIVARVLQIPRATAYRWRQQFLKGNESGLIDRRFGPALVMDELRKPRGEKEQNDAIKQSFTEY